LQAGITQKLTPQKVEEEQPQFISEKAEWLSGWSSTSTTRVRTPDSQLHHSNNSHKWKNNLSEL